MDQVNITSADIRILKHWGKLIDTKVSLTQINRRPVVHIQDGEYWTFQSALRKLQAVAKTVVTFDRSEAEGK